MLLWDRHINIAFQSKTWKIIWYQIKEPQPHNPIFNSRIILNRNRGRSVLLHCLWISCFWHYIFCLLLKQLSDISHKKIMKIEYDRYATYRSMAETFSLPKKHSLMQVKHVSLIWRWNVNGAKNYNDEVWLRVIKYSIPPQIAQSSWNHHLDYANE